MPRGTPDETSYTPQVGAEDLPRKLTPEMRGISFGPGLEALGSAVSDINQRHQTQDASQYISSSMAQLRVGAEQLLKTPADPDKVNKAGGFTPYVVGEYQKSANALMEGAPNDIAKRMLYGRVTDLGADVQSRALDQDAASQAGQRVSGALDSATKVATAVELNPSSWQTAGQEQLSAIHGMRLSPETQMHLSIEVAKQISEAAGRGYAKSDPQGTLNRLNDPNDSLMSSMSLESRSAVETYARGQLVDQRAAGIVDQFRTGGQTNGTQALASIDKDSSIPPDLRDEVRQRVNQGVSQLRDDSRQQHVQAITTLEENIAKGQVSESDRATAMQLYHANALDPSQLAGTLAGIDRAQIKQAQDAVPLAEVVNAYTNHISLDPKDKDVRTAADTVFQSMTRGQAPGSAAYTNTAAEMANRTGVVPGSVISWARANLTSGNSAAAAQAANAFATLEEKSPRALGFALGEDPQTKAMADTISQAVRAGTPADIAVTQARQIAEQPKALTDALEVRWKQSKADASQSGALGSLLKADNGFKPGMFSDVPTVPAALQGDFDTLTRRYYDLTGGNLNQARDLAARDVKREWGVSEVNGKREIMPYAPEAMFPGLSASMVRNDIANTVQQSGEAFQRMDPGTGKLTNASPAAGDVRLIPTDRTARTGGLEWQLGVPDQFGAMDVLRAKDGNPLVYRLPVSTTDFDAVRQRMAAAGLAKARQMQAEAQAAEALHDAERHAGLDDEDGMR